MRRDQLLALLRFHLDEMTRRFGVRSLARFGSHARDTAGPDSDVDLATPDALRPRLRPYAERDLIRVA